MNTVSLEALHQLVAEAEDRADAAEERAEIERAALEHDLAIVRHNAQVARRFFCTISGMEHAHMARRAGRISAFERLGLMVAVGPAALRRAWADFLRARQAAPARDGVRSIGSMVIDPTLPPSHRVGR